MCGCHPYPPAAAHYMFLLDVVPMLRLERLGLMIYGELSSEKVQPPGPHPSSVRQEKLKRSNELQNVDVRSPKNCRMAAGPGGHLLIPHLSLFL